MIALILIVMGVVALVAFLMNAVPSGGSPVLNKYRTEIDRAAAKWNVPPSLIAAVIAQESGGDPGAVGGSDEIGLMQLKPGQLIVDLYRRGFTSRRAPSFVPSQNIHDGTAGLRLLKDTYGNWTDALRAYNCCGTNRARVQSNPSLSRDYAESVIQIARENGFMGAV